MLEKCEQSHITEEVWSLLEKDTIPDNEYRKLLEHTCSCIYCADRLAHSMETLDDQLEPPVYLKDEIMLRASQTKVKAAVKIRETSKQLQLILYSLKVGLAVALSVFILSVTADFQDVNFFKIDMPRQTQRQSVTYKLNSAANAAGDKLNEISNIILNGGK